MSDPSLDKAKVRFQIRLVQSEIGRSPTLDADIYTAFMSVCKSELGPDVRYQISDIYFAAIFKIIENE